MWTKFLTSAVASFVVLWAVRKVTKKQGRKGQTCCPGTCAEWTLAIALNLLFIVVPATYQCWRGCPPLEQRAGPFITQFPYRIWRETSPKLFLLWTSSFSDPYWALPPSYKFDGCPVGNCRITINKNDLQDSDAVLFHSRNLWNHGIGHVVPSHHPEHQVWVLFDIEPTTLVFLDMKSYENFFNWTWTYRSESDVVSTYGQLVRRDNESVSWENEQDQELRAAGELFGKTKHLIHGQEVVLHDYYKEKTKFAAWTASNCMTQSRRSRVVKQMRKYLDIDTFGQCGDMSLECSEEDKPVREKCEDELGQYRFYLAFENSKCKDYHSEKLWYALQRQQIPVVYGGCDYSRILPRNSYIDVSDFASIKELTDYIKRVNSDADLYNGYLWWTKYYKAVVYPLGWCRACALLNDHTRPAQVYSDLDGWFSNDTCEGPSLTSMVSRTVEGVLLYLNIID